MIKITLMISKTYANDVKHHFFGSPRCFTAEMFEYRYTSVCVYTCVRNICTFIYVHMNKGLQTQKTQIQVGDSNKTAAQTAAATCRLSCRHSPKCQTQ